MMFIHSRCTAFSRRACANLCILASFNAILLLQWLGKQRLTMRTFTNLRNQIVEGDMALEGVICNNFSIWLMFNIKGGCESCDIHGLLLKLRKCVENKGVIFIFAIVNFPLSWVFKNPLSFFSYNWPYIKLDIYTWLTLHWFGYWSTHSYFWLRPTFR